MTLSWKARLMLPWLKAPGSFRTHVRDDVPAPRYANRVVRWADAGADGRPSAQARSWTEANRTATANLLVHNVVFERASA